MSYSHQAPYYLGRSVTGSLRHASAASNAGTDTSSSSGVLLGDDGDVTLTPSTSTIRSANDSDEAQSLGSLTPTCSLSASPTPSSTSKNAAVPSVDIGNLLQNEFDNLTIREKSQALASARKFEYPGSGTSSEVNTEILTKNDGAKIGHKHDTRRAGTQHDNIKPSLADWQTLCTAVGVTDDEMPVSITQCKKTLKGYNANLCDVSAALRNDTVAQTFPSIGALSRYSKREGKIMSKAVAKKDPLLKLMLKDLFRGDRGKGKN